MKRKLLLTSILSVIMCVSLIVGATFALFTSQDEVDMTVTSGEVVIEAKITDTQYKTLTEDYTAFTGTKALDLGGSVSVTEEGKVTFNKILPGDGIKFNIEVLNGSSVKVNYRTVITNSATSSDALFSVLAVKINNEEFNGEAVSNWDLLNVGTNGRTVEVEIELPEDVDGAEYMDKTCEFNVLVEAVQGNAPVANVNASGETKEETTLVDAMGNEAVAPAGVQLKDGANTLTLQVAKLENTQVETGNFVIEGTADAYAYNVSVPEVDPSNTKPIVITMDAPANKTGVVLFHKGVGMFEVASKDEVVNNNEFFYDPAGSITFATTGFSNFTLVAGLDGVKFIADEAGLRAALVDAKVKEVVFTNDIKLSSAISNGYGVTGIKVDGKVINGNGFTLRANNTWATWDSVIQITSGTIKNITVSDAMRGIFMGSANGDVVIDNVIFGNIIYTFNSDAGSKNHTVTIKNSKVMGWTSFSAVHKSVTFENCIFGKGNGYQYCRPYQDATFSNCEFEAGYKIEAVDGAVLTFANCKLAGVDITKENLKELVIAGADDAIIDTVVYTAEELDTAIKNGATSIILMEGVYVIPNSAAGKTLRFVGNGDVKIATNNDTGSYEGCNYALNGSTVEFVNVSINTPSTTYIGYAGANVTFTDCVFNGLFTLYGNSVFNNCEFNVSGDVYNISTWAAPTATFNGCTFNSDGKALLLYGGANTILTLNDCVFNDNGGLTDKKAAVEIGNDYGVSYELIVNNTIVKGYEINDKGINTGSTLWGNKNSMGKDKLNVIVDGVDVY